MPNSQITHAKAAIAAGWNDLLDEPRMSLVVLVAADNTGHSTSQAEYRWDGACQDARAAGLDRRTLTLREVAALRKCRLCDGNFTHLHNDYTSHMLLSAASELSKAIESGWRAVHADADTKTREARAKRIRAARDEGWRWSRISDLPAPMREIFTRVRTQLCDDADTVLEHLTAIRIDDAARAETIGRYRMHRRRNTDDFDDTLVLVGVANITTMVASVREDFLSLATHRVENTVLTVMEKWLAADLMCENAMRGGDPFVLNVVDGVDHGALDLSQVAASWADGRSNDRLRSLRITLQLLR